MAEVQEHDEFAAVLNAAGEVDKKADEVLTGPKPDSAVEVIDPAEAWAEIPALVGELLTLAMPELKPIYTPKACRAWGESMNRLAIKRGWAVDGLPPEVSVGLTSAMFVIPTIFAIKARRAAAQAARKQQEQQGGDSQHIPDPLGGASAGA